MGSVLYIYQIMKKQILLFIFCLVFALTSCHNEIKQVTVIAETYLTDMGNYRFEEAKKYATEEQTAIIADAEDFMKNISEENIQQVLPVVITIENVVVANDSAFIDFQSKSKAFQNEGYLKMVKQNGEWRACEQGRRMPQTIK